MSRRAKRKVRNAYFISTMSVALVLFLIGSIAYLLMNAQKATESILSEVSMSVMLNDDIEPSNIELIKKQLTGLNGIDKVSYTSKEAAAKEFAQFIGKDFSLLIDENPLPASFELSLSEDIESSEQIAAIESQIKPMVGVEEILFQSNIIDQVMQNIYRFKLIMLSFGGALLFVSIVLINNTIRMSIFSKRFIIKSMRLVGATDGFIRGPFIVNAFLQGFWATIIASIFLAALIVGLKQAIPEVAFITNEWDKIAMLFGGLLLMGLSLCFISTIISINKYIHLNDDDLYLNI